MDRYESSSNELLWPWQSCALPEALHPFMVGSVHLP